MAKLPYERALSMQFSCGKSTSWQISSIPPTRPRPTTVVATDMEADMRKLVGAALATLAVVASSVATAPAEAHWGEGWHGGGWHGGWRDHDGDGGDALLASIAGLAVGAAIADHSRPRYYYRGPSYYDYGPTCWTEGRWDPYYGGYLPVRVCR
jgi:hypothetical protein